MGAYTFCNGCDELLEFAPDYEGLSEEEVNKLKESVEALHLEERVIHNV